MILPTSLFSELYTVYSAPSNDASPCTSPSASDFLIRICPVGASSVIVTSDVSPELTVVLNVAVFTKYP